TYSGRRRMAWCSSPRVAGRALMLNSWFLAWSRVVVAPCVGDDGGVLVVRPKLGQPGGELSPLGPAWLSGEQFRVPGGHAERRAGGVLLGADPALAGRGCHRSASGSRVRRRAAQLGG